MTEVWKPVAGYEGLYEISNLGKVKNRHGKNLKIPLSHTGYPRIELWKNGKMKHFYVHRLVALAFVDNPEGLPQVNHKDENKKNNRSDNLEWCTQSENLNYGSHNAKNSAARKNHPDLSTPVECFTKSGELVCVFPSIREAERQFGVFNTSISLCCRGKVKTAGGYIWKYRESQHQAEQSC